MSEPYIHLGWDCVVPSRSIIMILDMDSCTERPATRAYIKAAAAAGRVREIAPDMPRSLVICRENGQNVSYITKLSPAALAGRLEK